MKKALFILLSNLFLIHAHAQDNDLVDHIHRSLNDCDFYEVTEEMFKSIAEDPRFQNSEQMEYIKKIEYLIFVECKNQQANFYENFTSGYNLKGFKVLMRTKSQHERFTFYKNPNTGTNEYLLIHDKGLSYIKTSLNISTLNEMSGIMGLVGELGG